MLSEIDPHKVEEIKLCVRNTADVYREVQYLCEHPSKPTLSLLRMVDKVASQDCGFAITRYESCEVVLDLLDQYESEKQFTVNGLLNIRQRMKNRMARLEADGSVLRKPWAADADKRVAHKKEAMFAAAYGASPAQIERILHETKEPNMTKPIKIETKHFINGQDVAHLDDAAMWSLIAVQERALKDLKAIENQPQSLKDHIAEIEAGIKGLVEFLDARAKKAA